MANLSILDWVCVVTAVLAPVPALWGAIKAWWTGEVGAGGRRPEPTVAALLANACGFLFGCTEGQLEPLLLNAWGALVQIVVLVLFVLLCRDGEMVEALIIGITFAAIHLATTLPVALSHIQPAEVYQWLCGFAGLLATAAPILTYGFLLDNPNVLMLPHWSILLCYTLHGLVWVARGWMMQNKYMMVQHGIATLCSVVQLALVLPSTLDNWNWNRQRAERRIQEEGDDLRAWLLGGLPVQEAIPHGATSHRT